jgi:hypothetical protein
MAFTQEQLNKINAWQEAQRTMREYRELELQLRAEVMAFAWPSYQNAPTAGTFRTDVASGYKLAYEQSFSYTLKDTRDAQIEAILANFPKSTADLLVKFEPKLSVSNYKKLPPDQQRLFTPVLTIKPDAPKLTLEFPKSK